MRGWHRDVNAEVNTDSGYPLGEFRGSGVTKVLRECNVAVGNLPGVLAERVAAELRRFEESLSRRLVNLDAESPGDVSEPAALLRVVELASFGHGEWVRIHPFADGNGRTARILSNWILVRYGLPPVLRLRPRPDSIDYANASKQSMATGDHRLIERYILDQLSRQFG
ncbi:MAG TPA: Fic family protein [Candidatus Baltobacterales bacterium]|nr:Fic family protein [Candidatus Baltobacterales bacterium]